MSTTGTTVGRRNIFAHIVNDQSPEVQGKIVAIYTLLAIANIIRTFAQAW